MKNSIKNIFDRKKLFLLFLLLLVSFAPANAQQISNPSLKISPHTLELKVKRGEIISEKIRILNQSGFPIPIIAKPINFGAEEETGDMFFYDHGEDSSFEPRNWIKVEEPNFILSAGETETVNFSIKIPEDINPGGYYATIIFEPQLPPTYFKKGQPKAIPKIGAILLFSVEIEGLAKNSEPMAIAEFNIPEKFHLKKLEDFLKNIIRLIPSAQAKKEKRFSIVETSQLQFDLLIKNNDIYHIKPSGKLAIHSGNNKTIGETEIPKTTILPGKSRKIPVEFNPEIPAMIKKLPGSIPNFISKNLFFGKYHASLLLDADGIAMQEEIEFWVFPWKFFLIIVFIMIVIILMRKRIKKAITVLIRKK